MAHIVVMLPVYNEEARLERLLDRVRDALTGRVYRIVAVDDGSRDASAAILARRAADLPITTVTHPVNRGLAQTLLDGLRWTAEHCGNDDVVVTMDADDTHDPAYIAPLLEQIDAGADVAIASRFRPGSAVVGVPLHRRLFSYGVFALLRVFMPIHGVRDYACGYRAMRARLIREAVRRYGDRLLELRQWGFICTAELLWKLHRLGACCREVPFVLRYDYKEGVGHMPAGRTIAGYGLLVWKSWGSRRPTEPEVR